MATKRRTRKIKGGIKATPFYQTVKWITWSWAIVGIACITYAYSLLWDFKNHAETYNDFNRVYLTWDLPQAHPLEGWVIVADYCIDETCGRMDGQDIYYSEALCKLDRDEIAQELIDSDGVWAYRCVEFQEVLNG